MNNHNLFHEITLNKVFLESVTCHRDVESNDKDASKPVPSPCFFKEQLQRRLHPT